MNPSPCATFYPNANTGKENVHGKCLGVFSAKMKKELCLFCNLSQISQTQQSGPVRRSLKALEMSVNVRSVGKEDGREKIPATIRRQKIGKEMT